MKRFWIMVAILVLAASISIGGLILIDKYEKGELRPMPVDYTRVKVESGDTLWALGMQSNGWNRIDNTYVIADMKHKSDVTSMIYPGDIVYIPIYDLNDAG